MSDDMGSLYEDLQRECIELRAERDAAVARQQQVEAGFHRLVTGGFDSVMALMTERDALRELLRGVRAQLLEGRVGHDWLMVSNVECAIDAALGEKP